MKRMEAIVKPTVEIDKINFQISQCLVIVTLLVGTMLLLWPVNLFDTCIGDLMTPG